MTLKTPLMRYCTVFYNRNLNEIEISIINVPGFFVQGSGLDRTSTFATAIGGPVIILESNTQLKRESILYQHLLTNKD